MANAKIIGIHDGKHIETDASVRPLPLPIVKLRDQVREQIKNALRLLFDNADDAFFTLADKAGSNGDQNLYLESMRELRLQKKYIANTFLQQLILSFNNFNHLEAQDDDGYDFTDLDNLSLLKNDELEINVALEGMASRLRSNATAQLEDLHKRIESLSHAQKISAKSIPICPELLCEAFAFACAESELELKAKLIVFKLFEKYVLNSMLDIYQAANQLLIQLGVLPNLKKDKFHKTRAQSSTVDQSGLSGEYSQPDVPVLGKEQCLTAGKFEQIRQLMHPHVGSTMSTDSASSQAPSGHDSSVVFLNQDQLVSTLTQQQFQASSQPISSGVNQSVDFRDLITSAYLRQHADASSESIQYSDVDNDIINLVSMLFDFILDDRQLQPAMKALIARLQIPILKVALMDKSFFDRGGHPARKLLNEMASAAIGWSENSSGQADRLKSKIEYVVEKVLSAFDANLELFDELLTEFSQFIDLESRRGQLIEQRTKDTEKGKAATELAKKISETTIHSVIQTKEFNGQAIPDCVMTLLKEGWSRVMILDYLKLGEESSEWKGHQRFIYDLLWSVCPSEDGSEARGKLLQLIPVVVRRLRQGLLEVSFDELRLNGLLAELEKQHVTTLKRLHKQALADQQASEQAKLATIQTDTASAGESLQESIVAEQHATELNREEVFRSSLDIEDDFKAFQEKLSNKEIHDVLAQHEAVVGDKLIESPAVALGGAGEMDSAQASQAVMDDSDPFMQQVSRLSVGGWFEFTHTGQAERAKLAAVIKINGHFIFVNRSGVKVAEKTKLELATEMKAGLIQVLNDGLLFDRALESIIGNLRGQA